MKLFYIKNKDEIFFKEIDSIKLNNNIKDRFKVYQYLKRKLKSKISKFYLFYDNDKVLNCFLELKKFEESDGFIKIDYSNEILNNYFLYKNSCELAKKYHSKQIYGGFLPYIFHLNKVDGVIDCYFFNIPADKIFLYKIGAMLHDIIEDTDYTLEELDKSFGNYIKQIVYNVTKINEKNTKEYEEEYYNKVSNDLGSIYVKLADKIINAKQTLKDKSKNHLIGMTRGHPIFQDYIYNKINDNDIKNHLDFTMKKMEKLISNKR